MQKIPVFCKRCKGEFRVLHSLILARGAACHLPRISFMSTELNSSSDLREKASMLDTILEQRSSSLCIMDNSEEIAW